MINHKHVARVKAELVEAGMTHYGLLKLETDHLPEIIHNNEHIKGVIYGRLVDSIDSVMLVATDKRILFVDCKPLYMNSDEISYEVVAGVNLSIVGPFAGVVLHTRVKEYSLRFVNINCAKIFVNYIENHIETGIRSVNPSNNTGKINNKYSTDIPRSKVKKNVSSCDQEIAVLSTANKYGEIHGSIIHYTTDKDENYYFLSKTETLKSKNILQNNRVVLTIHPPGTLRSLEIKGTAVTEKNPSVIEVVFQHITSPKIYKEGEKLPPISKINKGSYIVYKIKPTETILKDYSEYSW